LVETKRGTLSVKATDWAKLAKVSEPFPNRREASLDAEVRYRQRYLDLAVNNASLDVFVSRSKVMSVIRAELDALGFIEVETPILQSLYGGASAKPFVTHHNYLDQEMYLRIAPELYLKRLVVGGITKVFELGKVFRNEGTSSRHNPEFTMLEAYAALWDYKDQMALTESLVEKVALSVNGLSTVTQKGKTIDLKGPWQKNTMQDLVSGVLGEEFTPEQSNIAKLRRACELTGTDFRLEYGAGKLMTELYEKLIEPKLEGPIFVMDYPIEVSPLAREHRSNPLYAERFEGIIAGRELCNGYTELNDPDTQYKRFLEQERAIGYDDESMRLDHDYIRALKYGLPPTAGLGIGIDRLVMLVTGAQSIKDVILFPAMRPDGFVV
jgi:lysyl-tRNA synthetase class 2